MTRNPPHYSHASARTLALGHALVLLGCAAALGQTPPPQLTLAGAPPRSTADEQTISEELKGLEDPTILQLEMYFPATFLLPHRWSVSPRYEAKVDFKNDNYVTHSAKLLVAKQLNHPPLGFALSIKRSFDGRDKEFQVNFIVTYYFRN